MISARQPASALTAILNLDLWSVISSTYSWLLEAAVMQSTPVPSVASLLAEWMASSHMSGPIPRQNFFTNLDTTRRKSSSRWWSSWLRWAVPVRLSVRLCMRVSVCVFDFIVQSKIFANEKYLRVFLYMNNALLQKKYRQSFFTIIYVCTCMYVRMPVYVFCNHVRLQKRLKNLYVCS